MHEYLTTSRHTFWMACMSTDPSLTFELPRDDSTGLDEGDIPEGVICGRRRGMASREMRERAVSRDFHSEEKRPSKPEQPNSYKIYKTQKTPTTCGTTYTHPQSLTGWKAIVPILIMKALWTGATAGSLTSPHTHTHTSFSLSNNSIFS